MKSSRRNIHQQSDIKPFLYFYQDQRQDIDDNSSIDEITPSSSIQLEPGSLSAHKIILNNRKRFSIQSLIKQVDLPSQRGENQQQRNVVSQITSPLPSRSQSRSSTRKKSQAQLLCSSAILQFDSPQPQYPKQISQDQSYWASFLKKSSKVHNEIDVSLDTYLFHNTAREQQLQQKEFSMTFQGDLQNKIRSPQSSRQSNYSSRSVSQRNGGVNPGDSLEFLLNKMKKENKLKQERQEKEYYKKILRIKVHKLNLNKSVVIPDSLNNRTPSMVQKDSSGRNSRNKNSTLKDNWMNKLQQQAMLRRNSQQNIANQSSDSAAPQLKKTNILFNEVIQNDYLDNSTLKFNFPNNFCNGYNKSNHLEQQQQINIKNGKSNSFQFLMASSSNSFNQTSNSSSFVNKNQGMPFRNGFSQLRSKQQSRGSQSGDDPILNHSLRSKYFPKQQSNSKKLN